MNVFVIGGGGREDALIWKLKQSPRVGKIFCAPGNAGIAARVETVDIAVGDVGALLQFAKSARIDLTVVGPEQPLSLGIVDAFEAAGMRIFGPRAAAAQIEASKAFSKRLMKKYGIPTADAEVLPLDEVRRRLSSLSFPIVLKVDGLASGKGVVIAQDAAEAACALAMFESFGAAAGQIVVEQYLTGAEVSFFVLTDGETVIPLTSAEDHKQIFDGDRGPNTGGMGAISPSPRLTPALQADVMARIARPTIAALAAEGAPYCGVLYLGLMLTADGSFVLEYNARFGDPEAQAILVRLETDLVDLIDAALDRRLDTTTIRWRDDISVCVVLAAAGYPALPRTGDAISGLDQVGDSDIAVFHAGTTMQDGRCVTSGGRVLGVTAWGPSVDAARRRAYATVDRLHFDGRQYRRDIGLRR